MSHKIALTHVNLDAGFGWRQRQCLLLIYALQGRTALHQKLVARRGSILAKQAAGLGIATSSLSWPWPTAAAKASDLLHAHGQQAWQWAARARQPFVAGCTSASFTPEFLGRAACAAVDSSSLIERLHASLQHLPVERLPPMIDDLEQIDDKEQETIASLGRKLTGSFVFGSCIRADDQSGLEQAIEAMRWLSTRHPQVRLVLVGDGPLLARLKDRARSVDSVLFAGASSNPAAWYELFDAYVCPVYDGAEGVLQAMAMALPIAASRVPSMDDFLQSEINALQVPGKDAGALSLAMQRLFDEPGLAMRLGQTAQRHSARFTPELITERAFRIYHTLVTTPYVR